MGARMSCSKRTVSIQKGVESNSGEEAFDGSSGGRIAVPRASMTEAKRDM